MLGWCSPVLTVCCSGSLGDSRRGVHRLTETLRSISFLLLCWPSKLCSLSQLFLAGRPLAPFETFKVATPPSNKLVQLVVNVKVEEREVSLDQRKTPLAFDLCALARSHFHCFGWLVIKLSAFALSCCSLLHGLGQLVLPAHISILSTRWFT